jgi:RepB DNA-primase from phage plasmid
MTTLPDERSVHDFLEVFVCLAIASLGGHPPPGVLQTTRKFPDDLDLTPSRYALDQVDVVDRMTRDALADSEAGANVYIEARLLKFGLRGKKRGELSDTAWVFALAVDSDGDKNMAWIPPLGVRPTLVVETSPGNHQFWFFFNRALSPKHAQRRGENLRRITGGDADTGSVCQPYRLGGTVNFVSKAKIARGRIVTPTLFLGAAL